MGFQFCRKSHCLATGLDKSENEKQGTWAVTSSRQAGYGDLGTRRTGVGKCTLHHACFCLQFTFSQHHGRQDLRLPCFPHMETEFWVISCQSVLHCVWCPAVSVQCHLCQCTLWNSESCWWFFQSKTFPAKRKWESWRPYFFKGPPAPKPSSRNWDRLLQTIPAFPFIRKSRAKHGVSSVSELKKTLQLGQKLVFVCKHATSRHRTSASVCWWLSIVEL